MTEQPDPHNLGLMLGRMDAKLDGLKDSLSAAAVAQAKAEEAHAKTQAENDARLKKLETKNLWDRAVFSTLVSLVAAKDYLIKVLVLFGAH